MYRELGDRQGMVHCLEGFAALAIAQARPERAVRLAAAAATLRDAIRGPGSPTRRTKLQQMLRRASETLSQAAYAAAWAQGRSMSFEQAVGHALTTEEPAPATAMVAGGHVGARGSSPLTARELEVAALVARGLTNRQIAAELIIGERTADAHVGNILAKLGFTSRAQIAVWAVERGLTSAVGETHAS